MGLAIRLLSRKFSPASTTSLISCIRSVLSSTGTSARVWRKAHGLRPARTWRPLRRTTKKWASRPQRVRERTKAMETSSDSRECKCQQVHAGQSQVLALGNILDLVWNLLHIAEAVARGK